MKNILYSNPHQQLIQPAYNDIVKEKQREQQMQTMLKNNNQPIKQNQQTNSSRSSTPKSQLNTSTRQDNNNNNNKSMKSNEFNNKINKINKENNQSKNNNSNNDDPIAYYKKITKSLKDQLKDKDQIIQSLKSDNDHLRTLNTEYVKSINDVIHKKVEGIQSIIIDKKLFESDTFKSDSKKVITKLENNLSKVEAQLKTFIKHCRVMEADIEVYKKKIVDADYILQGLKKTGEFSIDTLVYKLKYNDDRIQELEAENRKLQYDNCLNFEKIRNFEIKYGDIEMNYEDSKQEYQDLILKHNRLISECESRKNSDQRSIYELKCKNDTLEHELRTMQKNIDINNEEKIDSKLQVVELTQQNETLRSTFMSSKRSSTAVPNNGNGGFGGFSVQFKQF